jgi:hypothetical protein
MCKSYYDLIVDVCEQTVRAGDLLRVGKETLVGFFSLAVPFQLRLVGSARSQPLADLKLNPSDKLSSTAQAFQGIRV